MNPQTQRPEASAQSTAIVRCVLRDPYRASTGVEAWNTAGVIDAAASHRVLPLLAATLRAAGTLDRWPEDFRHAATIAERNAAAVDCIRHAELIRVLDALNAAGARALIFKGAALAYTHYPAPHLRERTDSDVLIARDDVEMVERELALLGYTPQHETSGRLVSYQSHYGKRDRHGVFHALDIHWKVSNRHALADRVGFGELWNHRVPVAALGRSAATVCAIDALLLALLHRAGHHPGSTNLLWVYDLHVLASRLTASERQEVATKAVSKGLGPLVFEGLSLTRDWFATPGLDLILPSLLNTASRTSTAPMIPPQSAQADIVRQDLRALSTWGERGRLVREHLFPPASYIRGKYQVRSALLLPAFYAWRIVAGAPRWLRRSDHSG
jgi:Uncharacterised nucleotidyltransferase